MGWQDAPVVGGWQSAPLVEAEPPEIKQEKKLDPTEYQKWLTSWIGRTLRGVKDPIDAGAQMLSRAAGVIPGLEGEASRVDEMVRKDIGEYEQARKAVGQSGFDVPRTIGSSALQLAALRGLPAPLAGASLPARAGIGAATGAAYGALQPVTEGDFTEEKVKQAGIGAATGAIAAPLTETLARLIKPKVAPGVQALREEGVFPTLGQAKGGLSKSLEEKAISLPFVGDAIKSGQQGATAQLNEAAWNRALAPLGQKLPMGVVGREAVEHVDDVIDKAYRNVIDNIGAAKVDTKLMQDLYGLRDLLANASQDAQKSFGHFLKTQINERMQAQNMHLTGEQIKGVEEMLGRYARDMSRSNTAAERQLGAAYREAQASLRDWLSRVSPENAQALKSVNAAYANFLRPLRAAGYLGAEDGVFTAAQLQSAVKAADPTKHHKAFAEGRALMQDLSEPAKNVLTNKVPNSGTTDRALLAYLLANPVKGAAGAAGALPVSMMYSDVGRKIAATLGSRPPGADPLAQLVRESQPLIGGGLYGLLGAEY